MLIELSSMVIVQSSSDVLFRIYEIRQSKPGDSCYFRLYSAEENYDILCKLYNVCIQL